MTLITCYLFPEFYFYVFLLIFIKQFSRMPNLDRKYEAYLFRKPTTYTDCYQVREPRTRVPVKNRVIHEKPRKPRPAFVPIKDIHALKPWRDPNIPFNLFHKPDPIIRGDPRKMQERYEKPEDEDRAKVQKSRPKVIMSPANDVDAIQEPYRKMVVDSIYLTMSSIAQKAAVAGANFNNVRAPLPNSYSKSRPISIEPVKRPYVSPEWRMETVTWDGKQLRAYIDPTKDFWLTREKPYCSVCEDTAMRSAMNKTRI